tara:strand:- start:442 stop:1311 length:870 start_codon:yes stop_codon:yes gene_type:complete
MNHALVTGGCGFIGTNLVNKLCDLGYKVMSVDVQDPIYKNPNCIYINEDIRNFPSQSLPLFEKYNFYPNRIFHLAAITKIQESFEIPMKTISVNGSGPNAISYLNMIGGNRAKIIYASTSAIDGGYDLNPYVYGKWLGEETFKLYNKLYKSKVAIARFYNVYGPYQGHGTYKNVIPIFEDRYTKGKKLSITGDGKQKRDFIHVEDICEALIEIGDSKYNNCEVFNLGTGENISINELASYYNIDKFYIKRPSGEMDETLADLSYTFSKLKWRPKKDVKTYVEGWLNENN